MIEIIIGVVVVIILAVILGVIKRGKLSPFKAAGERMQRKDGVWDMNYFEVGRRLDSESGPVGLTRQKIGYRTGIIGGKVFHGDVPNGFIVPVKSSITGQTIHIIKPYITDSQGYQYFKNEPFIVLGVAQEQLRDAEMKMLAMAKAAKSTNDYEKLKQLMFDMIDLVEHARKKIETITPDVGMGLPEQLKGGG